MDSEMGLSGKTVLVVGTGISGIAAVNLLATQSANIILLDGNTELSLETVAAKFSEDIHYDLILGDLPDQVMDRIDLAVLSPGVPTDLPFVVRMQEAGIPIWGEIELAYVCGKGKVVAISQQLFLYHIHKQARSRPKLECPPPAYVPQTADPSAHLGLTLPNRSDPSPDPADLPKSDHNEYPLKTSPPLSPVTALYCRLIK